MAAGTPQTPVKWRVPLVREKSVAGAAAGLQNRVGLRKGTGRFDSYLLPPILVLNDAISLRVMFAPRAF